MKLRFWGKLTVFIAILPVKIIKLMQVIADPPCKMIRMDTYLVPKIFFPEFGNIKSNVQQELCGIWKIASNR